MDDGEFWEHVLGVQEFQEEDLDHAVTVPEYDPSERCDVCGSWTACAYDAEGNEMIHIVRKT